MTDLLAELDEVVQQISGVAYFSDPDARKLARFIRTHHATIRDMAKRLEAAERDAAKNIAYLKAHVPCTCSYSGRCGQRADGTYYGESKITWKCQRCRYIDAMQETGR